MQKLSMFICLRDLGHLCAEDSWFVGGTGSIGVEFFESPATNGSLGLIRVLLLAIFLLAPCARVEFRKLVNKIMLCVRLFCLALADRYFSLGSIFYSTTICFGGRHRY
jgi:hypothetical protein